MNNLNFISPEIFISLSIMFLLVLGVFKKESSKLIYNISLFVVLITTIITLNETYSVNRITLFNNSVVIDYMASLMKIITLIGTFLVLVISSTYLKIFKIFKIEYPILILSSVLGMMIMISSNDLMVFYMGLELQSLALYVLATFNRDQLKSSEAGLKYFVLSALSSGLLLYGCSLLYGFTGTTNFNLISSQLNSDNTGAIFAMVFILVGLAFKISAVPFHMWTPDVYEGAPTSITSFFAVIPKVAGLAVLIRFMQVPFENILLEWQTIIIFISIASMILGSLAAIGQTNIKRLMAYSSIGHIGYALAGVATGTISGYSSTIIYISIYAVMNIGAFGCIFLMRKDGKYKEKIEDLSGISKTNPLLAISFLIILFSLAGIPPLGGFFAKFYVFMSVLESEMYTLAIIGLLTTVISAFYYIKIIKIMYFDNLKEQFDLTKNFNITTTIFISCLILTSFFLYPSILNEITKSILIN